MHLLIRAADIGPGVQAFPRPAVLSWTQAFSCADAPRGAGEGSQHSCRSIATDRRNKPYFLQRLGATRLSHPRSSPTRSLGPPRQGELTRSVKRGCPGASGRLAVDAAQVMRWADVATSSRSLPATVGALPTAALPLPRPAGVIRLRNLLFGANNDRHLVVAEDASNRLEAHVATSDLPFVCLLCEQGAAAQRVDQRGDGRIQRSSLYDFQGFSGATARSPRRRRGPACPRPGRQCGNSPPRGVDFLYTGTTRAARAPWHRRLGIRRSAACQGSSVTSVTKGTRRGGLRSGKPATGT